MSKFTRSRLKYSVNERFFDKWTNQMAYILGFTYADGNVHKSSLSWDIQKRDQDVLQKFNKTLKSTYPIFLIRRRSYRLRISNQILVRKIVKKGLFLKKSGRDKFPKIPNKFLRHFIRGYLDGDGWITLRNHRNEVDLGFANGNKNFLEELNKNIKNVLGITAGRVKTKRKITPRGILSIVYQLEFYSSNAYKIANWLYGSLQEDDDIYLSRKYEKFLAAKNLYDFLMSGTRGIRIVQKKFGISIKELLTDLYLKQGLDGVKTAEVIGVHSSSVYRWLARTGLRYPEKRRENSIWTKLWS